MTEELFKRLKPFIIDEYKVVAHKSGITLANYLELRRNEIRTAEILFPGISEYYNKKIKRVGWLFEKN